VGLNGLDFTDYEKVSALGYAEVNAAAKLTSQACCSALMQLNMMGAKGSEYGCTKMEGEASCEDAWKLNKMLLGMDSRALGEE
jgi:hypothetical protein